MSDENNKQKELEESTEIKEQNNIKDNEELKENNQNEETNNTKINQEEQKKFKHKSRKPLVLIFLVVFAIVSYINLRGSYLKYMELGQNYVEAFVTYLKYRYILLGTNFIILYFIIYITNRGIKKGLKYFFEKEKRELPKLPNKSLALILSSIISVIMSSVLMEKVLLFTSNASFGISDPVFNFDISYYMFQKPMIQLFLYYFIGILVGLSIYMTIYYLLTFNKYFDGIDGKMIRESLLIKKITKNFIIIIIGVALLTILNTTDIVFDKMLTIKSKSEATTSALEITGAKYTDILIQRWGYIIFAFVMIIAVVRAVRGFKNNDTVKVLKNLSIIPIYLVIFFIIIVVFDITFVKSNILDKEKDNIAFNIENTKKAFNINIEELNLDNAETITEQQITQNADIINNTKLINENMILQTLEDNQTGTGHYSYRNANIAKYKISGKDKLIFISTREFANTGRTYNNKTYEYTHGRGQIVVDATKTTESGTIDYIQKEISGKDDILGIKNQEIYFGLETNDIAATNTKNKQEYDYIDSNGEEQTSKYNGKAGLNLHFLDRLILGITQKDLKLAFSNEISNESKILINRNIIKRAKVAMPYLIYDSNPYTVVREDGSIVWVIDAYTTSGRYPYSQYMTIEHDGIKEKVNYIRNSIKVLIDAYNGNMKFYITDETDPIAMAYRTVYPTIFEDIEKEIPEDISQHFIYPTYLFNIQANLLKTYHTVKPDVLYRSDDLWDFAKNNTTATTKSVGSTLKPYYTMIREGDNQEIGLIQIYTPYAKQNLLSYLVGTTDGSSNKLKLYKYSEDSNVLGPMQLDKQIEQDETILSEIEKINVTGTRVNKDLIIVPLQNSLLYIEPIFQTKLNDVNKIPVLKKVVVASGNKLAIGNNLVEALENLLSTDALNIEVENTDDINGLIDAIIKANNNLNESTNNKDWELMGSDIEKLQKLITSLEEMKKKEEEKEENTVSNNSISDNSIVDGNSVENSVGIFNSILN